VTGRCLSSGSAITTCPNSFPVYWSLRRCSTRTSDSRKRSCWSKRKQNAQGKRKRGWRHPTDGVLLGQRVGTAHYLYSKFYTFVVIYLWGTVSPASKVDVVFVFLFKINDGSPRSLECFSALGGGGGIVSYFL